MRKKLSAAAIVLGFFSIAAGSLLFFIPDKTASVSVIGSSDGPTSIFLAGKLGTNDSWIWILFGAVAALLGIFFFKRKK